MANSYVIMGAFGPIFVNETGTNSYAVPGAFVNETSTSGSNSNLLPLLGVGGSTIQISMEEALAFAAAKVIKDNPIVSRRGLILPISLRFR